MLNGLLRLISRMSVLVFSFLSFFFFHISGHPSSQYLFVFEWTDPNSGQMWQYILLQGFRDSPHLFAQVLGKELKEKHLKDDVILYYVDDTLICSPSMEASDKNTIEVFNFLGAQGYRVLRKRYKSQSNKLNIWEILQTPLQAKDTRH